MNAYAWALLALVCTVSGFAMGLTAFPMLRDWFAARGNYRELAVMPPALPETGLVYEDELPIPPPKGKRK
jgi:hypothetical protein